MSERVTLADRYSVTSRAAGLICALAAVAWTACEPSETDHERGIAELHRIEAKNRRMHTAMETHIPAIPEKERVACDVCPYWCQHVDLHPLPLDVLLQTYRRAAVWFVFVTDGSYSKAWEQLVRFACIVKAGGREMQRPFLRLLDDVDIAVRYCAAVHALQHGFATDEPLAVLRAISTGSTGLSMRASIQLQNWEGGIDVEL